MVALERLVLFHFYPPTRLVGGRHVVDSTEHTKYLSTIKYVSIILMILIDAKNGLGLMARDIGNSF